MAITHKDIDYTQLSLVEQILLAQDIWDRVLETGNAPATTTAQRTEVERRIGLVDSGQMPGKSWSEVKAAWRKEK